VQAANNSTLPKAEKGVSMPKELKENNEQHSDEKQKKQWVRPDVFIYPVERSMAGGSGSSDAGLGS
jgi:hypothetical protein